MRFRFITMCGIFILSSQMGLAQTAKAQACDPPCRSGYECRSGKCISQCNPPCAYGERCIDGECEMVSRIVPTPPPGRAGYLGVLGVLHVPMHDAKSLGEVRLEFGNRYSTFQIGPAFGDKTTMLRVAILGHVPFRPVRRLPLYLLPTLSLGYAYSWLDDGFEGHNQDIFIVPGLRLRYDIIPRLAVMADLLQVQVSFLRLYDSLKNNVRRQEAVPVTWNFALGFAFLY